MFFMSLVRVAPVRGCGQVEAFAAVSEPAYNSRDTPAPAE